MPAPAKEEAKAPGQANAAQKPAAAAKISLPVGDHVFKGTFTKDNAPQALEFVFHVVEGGIISSQPSEKAKYSLNGLVQDGKLTLKQQYEGDAQPDVELDGEFVSATQVRGTYKIEKGASYQFELNKLWKGC